MQLLKSQIPPLTAAALRMIISKRPVPLDHHLQEADHSRWPSARGRSLQIIICKRPALPDDHLQEASPSGSSFARCRPLILTTTKRAWKMHFWGPSQWDKCVLSVKASNFNETEIKIFTFVYGQGRGGWPPRPPYGHLTIHFAKKAPLKILWSPLMWRFVK